MLLNYMRRYYEYIFREELLEHQIINLKEFILISLQSFYQCILASKNILKIEN